MPDPPIRTSPPSSRNWPPVEIELRGSPRLAAAWALWCLALAAGVWVGCALPWWCRAGLVLAVLACLWAGVRDFLAAGGRLRWEADGSWRHLRDGRVATYVQMHPPRCLGPILWLAWPGRNPYRYSVVDSSRVEPKAWRAIKARMKLSGRAGHDGSP